MNRKDTGALGEKLAAEYLTKNQYEILEKNFRCREGEADIIANKDKVLVFIEVRAKRSHAFGTPEESINERKKEHLRAVARRYCEIKNHNQEEFRIDVIAIELKANGIISRFEHIENAIEDE
jgi:putative endonuclease